MSDTFVSSDDVLLPFDIVVTQIDSFKLDLAGD